MYAMPPGEQPSSIIKETHFFFFPYPSIAYNAYRLEAQSLIVWLTSY